MRREGGFSLVETLIAAFILVFGMLSIAQLLTTSVRMHQLARNSEEGARLALAKFEQLSKLDFATAQAVQVTAASPDPLATDVAGHCDVPSTGFTRRWSVQAGPTATTRVVVVRLVPRSTDRRMTKPLDVTTIIRQW
jgi:Tfp pilus assembly protein PilV